MKIALYLRVSTDVQDYNRQQSDLKARAEKDGNEIAYTFSDKVSGFKNEQNRTDLNKLLQLTKEDIQAVYISEFSRLSRNPTHLKVLIDHFTEKGINIYSLAQNLNTLNKEGKIELTTSIIISIFSEYGKYEIDLKNMRQKSGKKESITVKGNSYTGKPPYGYKKVGEAKNKKLVIDKKEEETITYIFNHYAAGTSIKELVQYLNLNKKPTRNTDFMNKTEFKVNKTTSISKDAIVWGKSSVRNILRNTVYCGYKVIYERDKDKKIISKERIITPAIVTEELFNKCQDEIKGRITNTDKSRINNFMLRGIFTCGYCGKSFVGTSSHKLLLYKCSDKTQVKSNSYLECRNTSIVKEQIEPIIWNAVKSAYIQLRSQQIKEGNIATLNETIADCNRQIIAIDTELDKLEKESDRVIKLYTKGLFTDSQIEKEQKRINADIEFNTRTKKNILLKISEAKETLQAIESIDNKPFNLAEVEQSFEMQKNAVHELVKQILIFKVDNKYTVFQINFKAGYKYYIIREVWTKKYHVLDGSIYSFNNADMMFTYSGTEQTTGYNYIPKTITQNSIDLFKDLDKQCIFEKSEGFMNMVDEAETLLSNNHNAIAEAENI
jgi:site-specific DNA recombinase